MSVAELQTAVDIELDAERRQNLSFCMPEVPSPTDAAGDLLVSTAKALMSATLASDGWRVSASTAEILRPFCLVDCRTPHLSAFGTRVRRALAEME